MQWTTDRVEIPNAVGFDFETHAMNPLPIDPPAVCLSIYTDLPLPPGIEFREYTQVEGRRGQRRAVVYLARDAAAVLRWFLAMPEAVLIAHNAPFDTFVSVLSCGVPLREWTDAYDAGRILDTETRERLLTIALGYTENGEVDPRTGQPPQYNLAYVARAHFGVDLSAEKSDPHGWRLSYELLDGVPLDQWPEEAVAYAALDSVWAVAVAEAQQAAPHTDQGPIAVAPYHLATEPDQNRANMALHWLNANMPKADPEWVERFVSYHTERNERGQAATEAAGLIRWNKLKASLDRDLHCKVGSDSGCPHGRKGKAECCMTRPCRGGWSVNTQVLQEMVLEDWGDETPRTPRAMKETDRPTLNISTAKEVLLDERSRAVLQVHGATASNRKMLNTYAPLLRTAQVVSIASHFKVVINTNRTSCGKPMNKQNPPAFGGFRECFAPTVDPVRPRVFASIDYSAIEVVALAQRLLEMFGHSALADLLNRGDDPHLWLAGHIYGMTYDEIEAAYKDPATKGDIKPKRQSAKAGVFGVPGGMGAGRMVDTYGVDTFLAIATDEERGGLTEGASAAEKRVVAEVVARRIKQVFLDAEPVLQAYFDRVAARTSYGAKFTWRDPVTGFQRGSVGYCDGCNGQFQGRAAAGAKKAAWNLFKACCGVSDDPRDHVMVGVVVWNFVHDEFLFEGPEDTAHLWAPRASEIMVESMHEVVPDVQVKAEPALMRRWYKAAEPVYDDNGRLVVWEPKDKPEEKDPLDALLERAAVVAGVAVASPSVAG